MSARLLGALQVTGIVAASALFSLLYFTLGSGLFSERHIALQPTISAQFQPIRHPLREPAPERPVGPNGEVHIDLEVKIDANEARNWSAEEKQTFAENANQECLQLLAYFSSCSVEDEPWINQSREPGRYFVHYIVTLASRS